MVGRRSCGRKTQEKKGKKSEIDWRNWRKTKKKAQEMKIVCYILENFYFFKN